MSLHLEWAKPTKYCIKSNEQKDGAWVGAGSPF